MLHLPWLFCSFLNLYLVLQNIVIHIVHSDFIFIYFHQSIVHSVKCSQVHSTDSQGVATHCLVILLPEANDATAVQLNTWTGLGGMHCTICWCRKAYIKHGQSNHYFPLPIKQAHSMALSSDYFMMQTNSCEWICNNSVYREEADVLEWKMRECKTQRR